MTAENIKRKELPFVSVVVPVLNERELIGRTISSLLDQSYPKEKYEIIIVDNGSNDGTKQIIQKYPVKFLKERKKSAFSARNKGARAVKGEYIVFMDADCFAGSEWLENLVDVVIQEGASIVAGKIENYIVRDNFANKLLAKRCAPEVRKENVQRYNSVASGNMIISRRIFEETGFFEICGFASDNELSRKVFDSGGKISYTERAVVKHQCDLSNREYLVRSFLTRYGQEKLRKRPEEARHILRLLLSFPWRPGFNRAKCLAGEFGIDNPAIFALFFMYIWIERIFSYFGSIAGAVSGMTSCPEKSTQ
ncbi:MAG: glycosyltransferase [Candidatus Omnitrophota bacterium]|nr:glycosyltransferase [Candidatus Omnitrophota bacterium]